MALTIHADKALVESIALRGKADAERAARLEVGHEGGRVAIRFAAAPPQEGELDEVRELQQRARAEVRQAEDAVRRSPLWLEGEALAAVLEKDRERLEDLLPAEELVALARRKEALRAQQDPGPAEALLGRLAEERKALAERVPEREKLAKEATAEAEGELARVRRAVQGKYRAEIAAQVREADAAFVAEASAYARRRAALLAATAALAGDR
jgi:hypothetical protein